MGSTKWDEIREVSGALIRKGFVTRGQCGIDFLLNATRSH